MTRLRRLRNLPGVWGIFNQVNFHVYHYAGNNPVKYVDPDGRELEVSGTDKFKEAVEDALQEIHPSAVVDIEKNGKGKGLLDNLISSDNTHSITETQKGNSASPMSDYKEGEGSGSTINFDPYKQTGGQDSSGSDIRPPSIGLSHELGHSEAIDNGTQSRDRGNKTPRTTPPAEINSMRRENEVRKENGQNLRPSYYDAPLSD